MGRPKLEHIKDTKKQAQLKRNLSAMEEQLGCTLVNFLSKKEKSGDNSFADQLKKDYRPVYDATTCLLPSSTLDAHLRHPDGPPPQTVDRIADFCSRAFEFDTPISKDDLLTRDISFPSLLKTGHWDRYKGVYRCFYINPDETQPQLNGGLLKVRDNDGKLQAFLVTGVWRDRYFDDLERILDDRHFDQLTAKCQAYSHQHPDAEMRLVTYQGAVETTIQGYFLLRLPRAPLKEHSNTALVLLRRFDTSAQSNYSGGIASVTLCRGDNLTSYAMVVVRERLSLSRDGEFLTHYLDQTDSGPKGIQIKKDLDETWNRDTFSRIRNRKD